MGCPKGKPIGQDENDQQEGNMKKIASLLLVACLLLSSYGCWEYARHRDYPSEDRHDSHHRDDYRDRENRGDRSHDRDQDKDRDDLRDRDERHDRDRNKAYEEDKD
jgi:hypothetical protein